MPHRPPVCFITASLPRIPQKSECYVPSPAPFQCAGTTYLYDELVGRHPDILPQTVTGARLKEVRLREAV